MKKMFWFILAICLVGMLIYAAAEKNTTVYVSNGGTGNGADASSPVGSLTEAYKKVLDGGEIVIVGDVSVPLERGDTTRSAFTEPRHTGKITVRGYNDSSVLHFDRVYEYHLSGDTEIKELTVSSGAYTGGIMITARGYHLTMGEGLSMKSTGSVSGEVGTKVYLMGGCIPGATREGFLSRNNHLTVKSGAYWGIVGFNRSINQTSTGVALIEVGGDVHTRFLIAGSSSTSSFVAPSGCDMRIIGDISISKQISLGNQNSAVASFDCNLIIEDGNVSFTGDYIDYNARVKLTSLDIYVNRDSASAVDTYTKLFAGYGDREGTIMDYCKNELGGHKYTQGICEVCGVSQAKEECTEHSFKTEKNGSVILKTCDKCGHAVKDTEKTESVSGIYTYKTDVLRVQILSDGIVRVEENTGGAFTDENTLVVENRDSFEGDRVVLDEDEETVILSTPRFTVNIPKKDAGAESVRVSDKYGKLIYDYFETQKHGFYASLPAPSKTPDCFVLLDNGIIPAESGLTYNGSTDGSSGWRRRDNTDIYVLVALGDSIKLREEFTELTGSTMLSDIKTLGSWYSKWTNYTAEQKLSMVAKYRENGVPLDMIVIDTEWKNTSVGGNGGSGTGYDTNDALYPDMAGFLQAANDAGVLVLFNDHTHQTSDLITSPAELKWQSEGIISLMKKGLDGWWYDRNWTYSIKSPYKDVTFSTLGQVLYYDTMAKYHNESKDGEYADRVLMLSNVDWIKHGHITGEPSVIGHRYGIQWTGDIYGDSLQLRREIENMVLGGASGASPYMSSDLGGFWHNDTVTENNFIRWMQYGAFSPVVRVHSNFSSKNEHLPWSYGEDAQAIVTDYLNMRYHLMPYYYMLARENYEGGMPLMRRLDFYYPQYEEAADNSQYLIGKDILAAPFWSTRGDGQYAVPSSWLKNEQGEQGLTARYYNITKDTSQYLYYSGTPALTETVPNIDFYWYTGSPAPEVNTDYFAARFTGTITPEYDCYIGTLADDGAKVYVNGKLWVNGFESSQVKPYINNREVLKAGKSYEIVVEYYDKTGRSILYFVCEPVTEKKMSSRSVFIPDGVWINAFTGEETKGPCTVTVTGDITQMPLFIRKGAAIPVSRVESPMDGADWGELSVNIYGLSDTSFELYEDDGATEAYLDGLYRKTSVGVKRLDSDRWVLDIGAAEGGFATDYDERTVKIRIHSNHPVLEASIGGETLSVSKIAKDDGALPFADSGASNIYDVYEISVSASIAKGSSIEIRCEVPEDTGDGGETGEDTTPVITEDDGEKEGFGVWAVCAAVGAVLAVCAGCVIYFFKRKSKA